MFKSNIALKDTFLCMVASQFDFAFTTRNIYIYIYIFQNLEKYFRPEIFDRFVIRELISTGT